MSAPLLVTGGTGFVGQVLVQELLQRGEHVRALLRPGREAPQGVEVVRGDLERLDQLAPALRGCRAVFHVAALLDPVTDAAAGERINHLAAVELARLAAAAGVGCFVHVSTMAAVGFRDMPHPVGPSAPCEPAADSIYARTKLAAERGLQELPAAGMRLVIVRPPTVYGAGELRNFLALTRAVATGLFPIPGGGHNRVAFCHVRNLTSALRFVEQRAQSRGVLHVADLPAPSLRQLVQLLGRELGRRPLPLPFPLPLAWLAALGLELGFRPLRRPPPLSRARLRTLTANYELDCSELERLGWSPPVSTAQGVAQTVRWYREQGLVARG